MHSVCKHSGRSSGAKQYKIDCGQGKLFVEVGSSMGHVAMYAATRGMRVKAVEPLEVNLQRIRESMCVNGAASCLKSPKAKSLEACRSETAWENYSPQRVCLFKYRSVRSIHVFFWVPQSAYLCF